MEPISKSKPPSLPEKSYYNLLFSKCFQSLDKPEKVFYNIIGKNPSVPESLPIVHLNHSNEPKKDELSTTPPPNLATSATQTRAILDERRFLEKIVLGFFQRPKEERLGKRLFSAETEELASTFMSTVQSKDSEAIKSIMKRIASSLLVEVVPYVLRKLSLEEKNEDYLFLIAQLREANPSIERYILSEEKGPILTPEGIDILVGYLREHKSLLLDCKVCKNINDFEKELANFKTHPSAQCCFIVKNFGNHVTPVYVEKKDNYIRCVITDSMGDKSTGEGGYYKAIYGSLMDVLEDSKTDFQVFACTTCRQRDHTNCPIFSLRDVVYFSQHGNEMLQDLEKTADNASTQTGRTFRFLRPFERLPPVMMMTTQSIKQIEQYDTQNPKDSLGESVYSRIKGKGYLSNSETNNLIQSRYLKYERLLIAVVIASLEHIPRTI